MSTGEPISDAERADFERLREEHAKPRAHALADPQLAPTVAVPAGLGHRARAGRWTVVTILLVIVSLLAPFAVLARYVRSELLDTNRYVDTVAPLASDPVVQNALSTRITDTIFSYLDLEPLTEQALGKLADLGVPSQVTALAQPIAGQVHSFVGQKVNELVKSPTFADLWVQANRVAHKEMVSALIGEGGSSVSVKNGEVSVNLVAFIDMLKQRLVAAGFALAARIPKVDATFVIFESKDLAKTQKAVRALDRTANLLPVLALVLLGIALLVAPGRRKALAWGFAGIAVVTALFAIGVTFGRTWYLDNLPSAVHSQAAAQVVIDTLLQPLRVSLRALIIVSAIIAIGAWVAGPSSEAVTTRLAFTGGARACA